MMKNDNNNPNEENQFISLEDGWHAINQHGLEPFFERLDIAMGRTQPYIDCLDYPQRSYIRTYDTIFTMCIQREPHNYLEQLYERLIKTYDDYFKNRIMKHLKKCQKESNGNIHLFLKEWINVALTSKYAIDGCVRMFMYLDRFPNDPHQAKTSTAGYLSLYLNVLKLFSNYTRDCILRLVEIQRISSIEDYDKIIHKSCKVFVEIDNKILGADLPITTEDISIMDIVINGYTRNLEISNCNNYYSIIPIDVVSICTNYYGTPKFINNSLYDSILNDLVKQTLNFYLIKSLKWINLGIRQYFINLDKAMEKESYNYFNWFSTDLRNEIIKDIISKLLNQHKIKIDILFEQICDHHIVDLFDTYLSLQNHFIRQKLLNKIIEISSKFIDSDIQQLIDNAIDNNNNLCIATILPLINFLRGIFSNNTKKIRQFMITIYFHNKPYSISLSRDLLKISKETTSFLVENWRNNRINDKLDRLLYFY